MNMVEQLPVLESRKFITGKFKKKKMFGGKTNAKELNDIEIPIADRGELLVIE